MLKSRMSIWTFSHCRITWIPQIGIRAISKWLPIAQNCCFSLWWDYLVSKPRHPFHDYFPKHRTKCSQHHRFAKHQLTQNKASWIWLNSSMKIANNTTSETQRFSYICVASSRPQIFSFLLPVESLIMDLEFAVLNTPSEIVSVQRKAMVES